MCLHSNKKLLNPLELYCYLCNEASNPLDSIEEEEEQKSIIMWILTVLQSNWDKAVENYFFTEEDMLKFVTDNKLYLYSIRFDRAFNQACID